jgi:sugar lactone lactonase YvrE
MLKKYFYLLTGFALLLGCAFPGVEALAKSLPATKTEISLVDGIAVDKKGNVYIARRDNNVISRIDLKGNMTTYVGTGSSGFSGDGGKATDARLNVPAGLAFDKDGNLYIADRNNHRIRKVDTRGIITTIAGTGTAGFSGDGGPATQAQLNLPSGIAIDGKSNLFLSDRSNNRIRVIDSSWLVWWETTPVSSRLISKFFPCRLV